MHRCLQRSDSEGGGGITRLLTSDGYTVRYGYKIFEIGKRLRDMSSSVVPPFGVNSNGQQCRFDYPKLPMCWFTALTDERQVQTLGMTVSVGAAENKQIRRYKHCRSSAAPSRICLVSKNSLGGLSAPANPPQSSRDRIHIFHR